MLRNCLINYEIKKIKTDALELKKPKIVIFIIPYHRIGGAERVHLNIIKALPNKPIVFFDCSISKHIDKEFRDNSCFFMILGKKRIDYIYKFIYFISFFFQVYLFGCNSILFYQFILKLKGRVKTIDLTHAFTYCGEGMENFSLPYLKLLDKRVVINRKTFEDYKQLYINNNINQTLLERFIVIPNGIEIKDFNKTNIVKRFQKFTIGFVGRNSKEKRPELFFELVKKLKIRAKVIGDNFDDYKKDFPNVHYFENCNDKDIIREQFSDISLLIVCSKREGFPLVIMEAMELGIPVITTNVGSIPDHLIDNINGFLVPVENHEFISFSLGYIKKLIQDEELYLNMSLNARNYAVENFGIEEFKIKYREMFYG